MKATILVNKSISTKFSELLSTPQHFGVNVVDKLVLGNEEVTDTMAITTVKEKIAKLDANSKTDSESKPIGISNISVSIPLRIDLFGFRLQKFTNNLCDDSKLLAMNHFLQQLPYYIQHRDEKFISDQELGYFRSPTLSKDSYYVVVHLDCGQFDKYTLFLYIENAEKQGYYRYGYIMEEHY